ncbi:MAG: transglycosylase SLT domain-containing protein [Bacteroidota bacterium]
MASTFFAMAGCKSDDGRFLERTIVAYQKTSKGKFVDNSALFKEGWDTLSHVRFWQEIMTMPHDSLLFNIADLRHPLFTLHASDWSCQTVEEKDQYKRLVCVSNDLSSATSIYATSGKQHFFEFRKVLPMIPVAIEAFELEGTDPWYAQTILLIESPGKTEAVSYAGARGAFQLMPSVARSQGLVVNKSQDDRTDLRLSAIAAARFIRKVCVVEAKRLLTKHEIEFNEYDLWFRLFVMHIYHSGAGNLSKALDVMQPQRGGMDFIRELWRTEAGGFKNESQNYSQVALAAMVKFDRLLNEETDSDTVYLVHGDKRTIDLKSGNKVCVDTLAYLNDCLEAYGSDLVEGVIPPAYFLESDARVLYQIERFCKNPGSCHELSPVRHSERFCDYANQMIVKRKFADAIVILEKSLEINPLSVNSYNLIISAYNGAKKPDMVLKYTTARDEMTNNPSKHIR